MSNFDFTDYLYDAQQGDPDAVRFIYDNTVQLFYKESDVLMQDKTEADAAVRDAYIFIFEHLDSLEDPSRFLLWANEICKNTCITRLRQRGVFNTRVPAQAASLNEIRPAQDYDPLINEKASMLSSHVKVTLEAILNTLPEDQRVCAILWAEGYPIKSIARKLGMETIAVNYTLACTLSNISNAVTTLSANGLKLFSMEPIPYFLWLLINYYRNYQPDNPVHGSESDFYNIFRILLPEEASVFSAETYTAEYEDPSGRVMHMADAEGTDNISFDDNEDLDFGFSENLSSDQDEGPEIPPMDIYLAHAEKNDPGKKTISVIPSGGGNADASKGKKKSGLLIALLIIFVIIALIAAGFLFFGDTMRSTISSIFGGSKEASVQEETTTEPEKETETTTEPETDAEPETTTEEVTGPEFTVMIYTGDNDSLALKAEADGDSERLLYVPDAQELYIDETIDGWGHTNYEGTEGWVWLYYTRVVGNAPVEEPETMLDEPETYTVMDSFSGLELRTGPGTYFSTFGPVPDGTEVTVEAYQDGSGIRWAYINYEGHYGWVDSGYLR